MIKCLAIDRNLKGCRCNAINDTRFCKKHDYMTDYTEEMLSNLQVCSGCKKSYYIPDGNTCCHCRDRGKNNRQINRENIVLCANDGCTFKRSKENIYCNKHQLCIFVDETVAMNKKVCKQYIRGCRSQLDLDYQYSRCQSCLEKDREQDKNRRVNAMASKKTDTHQTCSTCCKEFENSLFIGVNDGSTKTCKICRDANRIQDQKRDKEHCNELHRIADKKPERIAKKAEWKEANYEKIAMYCMNHRQRKIDEDIDEYLKRNAQNAKQWRDNNPDKVSMINQNKINNINLQYGVYLRSARDKNLDFEILQEDFNKLVKEPCHYCDVIQERGFNGIDRLGSNIGYIVDNCVSCCSTCNYMKCSLSVDVFLKRIEHILSYNNKIKGRYFPEEYSSYSAASYNEYKRRADNKSLLFEITNDEYVELIADNCYLCGRDGSNEFTNGIDRIDNNLGYIMTNVKSCCGSCNYIKKDMELNELFEKMIMIYDKHIVANIQKEKNQAKTQKYRNNLMETIGIDEYRKRERERKQKQRNETNITQNITKNMNKKTTEEKREESRIRKQISRDKLKEKYGDEEYKKQRAKELADYRKSKKETIM
tara:strand:+ start:1126 stop:2904 length:1779 start_codon:yes stop_codon:yes gene_type:complete